MAEAVYIDDGASVEWTPTLAITAGQVIQYSDGRAAFAPTAIAAGVQGAVQVSGIVKVLKVVTQAMIKGSKVWWDHSANTANLLQVNDRDFYLGIVQEDAAYAGTTVKVALNADPPYTIGMGDGFASLPVIVAGINHQVIGHAEGVTIIADLEAQINKYDALSLRSVVTGTPCMVDILLCVNENGDDAAFDFNVGLADDTHATDADSIVNSLFVHINGADLELYIESDNVTAEVAATDTTVAFVVGTPVLIQFDLRDWTDIQAYVDGVNVLPASTFALDGAVGPMKLLAHMEKTANNSPGNFTVMRMGLRAFAE